MSCSAVCENLKDTDVSTKYLSCFFFFNSINLIFHYYAMASTHLCFHFALCKNSQMLMKIIYSLFSSNNFAKPRVLDGSLCVRGDVLLQRDFAVAIAASVLLVVVPYLPPSQVWPQRAGWPAEIQQAIFQDVLPIYNLSVRNSQFICHGPCC